MKKNVWTIDKMQCWLNINLPNHIVLKTQRNCRNGKSEQTLVYMRCLISGGERWFHWHHIYRKKTNGCMLCRGRIIWDEQNIQEWMNTHSAGYKLLNIERSNGNAINICFQCANTNHAPQMQQWSSFRKSNVQCKECRKEKTYNNRMERLKKEFELIAPNYNLLDSCIKRSIQVKVQCKTHKETPYWVSLQAFRNGVRCKYCHNERNYNEYNYQKICSDIGYEYVSFCRTERYGKRCILVTFKDKDGFMYEKASDEFGSSHDFNKLIKNKFAIFNINRYCELYRTEYRCVSDKYIDTLTFYDFYYSGKLKRSSDDRTFKLKLSLFLYRGNGRYPRKVYKCEKKVEVFLQSVGIEYKNQKTFDDLYYNPKSKLRFDFYLPQYNLCIECQGVQHYEAVEYFGGTQGFKECKTRDDIKRSYCENNNIELLEIPYIDFDDNKYKTILCDSLKIKGGDN